MPFVADSQITVNVAVQDRDNNVGGFSVGYGSTNTLANIIAEVEEDLLPAAIGAIDGRVIGYTISYGALSDDFTQAPETSDIERKGVFQFQAANGQITKIELPSIKNTLVVDGSNVLNVADPLVAAVETAFLTPGVDGLAPVTNTGSNLVTRKGFPHKMHRRSRKG